MIRTADQVLTDYVDWAKTADARVKLDLPLEFRGIAPGELALLIARSYVGKSNILVNILVNRLDTKQLVISLEMPARQLVERMVAVFAELPFADFEDGVRGDDPQFTSAIDAARDAFENVYLFDNACSLDTLELLIEQVEPQLVTIDYLELLGMDGFVGDGFNHVVVSARRLKEIAKKYDTRILALHQVKREGGGWKPLTATDAKYAGETECDTMIGAYRPSLDPEMDPGEQLASFGEVWLQMLKYRGGTLIPPVKCEMDRETLRLTGSGGSIASTDGAEVSVPRVSGSSSTPAPRKSKGWPRREDGEFEGQVSLDEALGRVAEASR